MNKAAILMGSKNDFSVVKPCYDTLIKFGIEVDIRVMSAHRSPDTVADFARNAAQNGYQVLIAAAGKAAHLAGVAAGHTILPVIGIPVKSSTLDGLDSLLSVVQMPSGVPVATVAINGAENAAILAAQIMALSCRELAAKLIKYKAEMRAKTTRDNAALQQELEKQE
ncbi:MAG: 5-(carboxyamino)imidazole ribonucleotide mutase [Clostridia bacterium]|nr:5-(carboxyamino)imidazole ribonucleotide mutase [Clostridia bacterium]